MSTLDVTNLKSKLALTPTKFYDKDDKEIGTLCRAWVKFNSKVSPLVVIESFNISTVIFNSNGSFNCIFENPMPDDKYTIMGAVSYKNSDGSKSAGEYLILNGDGGGGSYYAPSTTQFRVGASNHGIGGCNPESVNVAVFR